MLTALAALREARSEVVASEGKWSASYRTRDKHSALRATNQKLTAIRGWWHLPNCAIRGAIRMERVGRVADELQPKTGEFRVELPAFQGPLDLLLHLIKKHELDILDLPVAFVTERYLEYLRIMQELDLDLASEYLLMAATLAHIKSKMLLPRPPDDQQDSDDDGEQQDPRLELIRRLLEYQKYKQAAEHLGSRSVAGRDVFMRGSSAEELQGQAPLAEVGLFKLLDAFQAILDRAKDRQALEVTAERITLQERIAEITDLLRERKTCRFEDLFHVDVTRYEVVVTFLALLEMTRLRVTRIYQPDYRSSIHVQYALLDADAPTIPPPSESEIPPAIAPTELTMLEEPEQS
jgi:segregation and condensation protein A